ncbi:MAG TPA: glycerate kinase [Candidatus Cybelea sp.]|nr:glycerate kinase [Candidatus Cybelea sp.]
MEIDRKELLRRMFAAAIGAVDPLRIVPAWLPQPPEGRTIVLGAGKAAAAMAKAVEDHWPRIHGGRLEGLVITRYGHGLATQSIEVVEAAHPVPDEAGQVAARRILERTRGLTPDDLVLCLISGGASALMAVPGGMLTLADKQAVNKGLLKSGANIAEMNCVRKHLSGIKGGRLAAAAHPARVATLLISDVPGDDPSVIGSGPTVADPTSAADAIAVIEKYRLAVPDAVRRHLQSPEAETPKPGDRRLAGATTAMIGTPQAALDAAAKVASEAGYRPIVLGDLEGEARDVALVHAGIARQVARHGQPAPAPAAVISGGETTVTVRGKGRGGRNAEFLLALAVALDGHRGIYAIAGDTDGIDGTEDNAGAVLEPDSLARAAKLGVDAKARLADNDGYGFYSALGDLVVTGPTRTNVNDFRAILIDESAVQSSYKGKG